ncbi:MAG: monofunctional biosynthetic peptidoglycan transglycosylase [Acidobacteriota bacterium]|nr:monofunctional biosynthetic peptidoglycan transglycosylase [Acidobacteriota bacterium]
MDPHDEQESPRRLEPESAAAEAGEAPAPEAQESAQPGAGDRAEEEGGRPRPRWGRRVLWGALALLVVSVLYQLVTWPDVAELAEANPESTAFIDAYEKRARRAGEEPAVRWQPVPYSQISPHLKRAVLVAEDIGFFDHQGFATEEVKAALKATLEEGKPLRGASTLSQQLVKNLWLSPSRNPWRKVKEGLLTMQLERELSKRRILELYLNVVELGPGIYGAEAAARHYFGKSASALSVAEAAALAASLPRPSSWHPGSGSRGYQNHIQRIRRRMDKATWLWKVI